MKLDANRDRVESDTHDGGHRFQENILRVDACAV